MPEGELRQHGTPTSKVQYIRQIEWYQTFSRICVIVNVNRERYRYYLARYAG